MSNEMKPISASRGFTLVEVLISTVVALFATLAIFQSFAVSEGYRRTATSGGDASFSGAVGTYTINRDLRMAGYGLNSATYLGCQTSVADQGPPVRPVFTFTLAPVQIAFGASAQVPDSITVVSSNTGMMPGPINFTASMASPTDNYTVTSAYGVNAGDLLVLAEGQVCTLAEASNTPTSATSNQNIIKHASSGANSRYNEFSGLGPSYSSNAVLFDFGPNPAVNWYHIQNDPTQPNFNSLLVDQLVGGQVNQPVAGNVVQLKAQYGKDLNGDGIVDTWNDTTTPATSADWAKVLAVRIALVARSAQPEKPNLTTGLCTTTPASANPIVVTWEDGSTTNLDVSGTAPAGPSWQCYRYRVFHVTSSLRNLIWTPS